VTTPVPSRHRPSRSAVPDGQLGPDALAGAVLTGGIGRPSSAHAFSTPQVRLPAVLVGILDPRRDCWSIQRAAKADLVHGQTRTSDFADAVAAAPETPTGLARVE